MEMNIVFFTKKKHGHNFVAILTTYITNLTIIGWHFKAPRKATLCFLKLLIIKQKSQLKSIIIETNLKVNTTLPN